MGAAFVITCASAYIFLFPHNRSVWYTLVIVTVVCAFIDMILLRITQIMLNITRNMPVTQVLGVPSKVELIVSRNNTRFYQGKIQIFDLYDPFFTCNAFPIRIKAPKYGEIIRVCYEVTPVERGSWEFPACEVLISSPLRFWQLKVRYEIVSQGRIYSNFNMLSAPGALKALLKQAGQRTVRKRGTGLEFDSLREGQPSDSLRTVDWRATARRGKVIVRQYIEEQDQQVLFILDSGYRLHRREGEDRVQFDSALNAALFLSWAALKHGDAAGGAVFGSEDRWVSPRRGRHAITGLMNAFYDVKSTSAPSSVSAPLENALSCLKRRTFIVLISNFREEDEEPLSWILPQASKRHLVLLVNMREPEAEALAFGAGRQPLSEDELLMQASAYAYLAARRKLIKRWEALGILTLESTAASLTPLLITSYLNVKRSGLL
jgi:uncharacterized protein (DUF58 family)